MGTRYRLQDGSVFFVTTTSHNFIPIFHTEESYRMGIESLGFCLSKYNVILVAFVFMPNHWHGILWQEGGFDLSGLMRDFKRFTSVQIRKRLVSENRASRFLTGLSPSGRKLYTIWKSRFDVIAIRTQDVLKTKVDYIHENPVRKGLVANREDWLWSSARFYIRGEDVGIPMVWIG